MGLERSGVEAVLARFPAMRVLVVGDVLLDEYRLGDVDRVSPEAPVPVVRVRREERALGGAANVARNVVSLGARCELVGLVGRDPEGQALGALLSENGIDPTGLVESASRPTTHKLRVVARAQQMLRLDREEDRPIEPAEARGVGAEITRRVAGCDLLILEDYDKGLFAEGLGRSLVALARAHGIPVVADPKRDLARFRGASLVKPNLGEALRFLAGGLESTAPASDPAARRSLLEKLRDALGGGEVVVTRGREGMSGLDAAGRVLEVPTRALEVYDVQGAGDTTIAALGLCRAAGASLLEACIVANAAAGCVVSKVGTAAAAREEVRARLPDVIEAYEVAEESGHTTNAADATDPADREGRA